jgi:hypothetical protein
MKWAWIAFFTAVISTAFFVPRAGAHELPCFPKEVSETLEPRGNLRGYGTTQEGLVKLSVTSSGTWMLTFSPPKMDGMACIVWLGDHWEFVVNAQQKARRHD